jgi:hypothetical protein
VHIFNESLLMCKSTSLPGERICCFQWKQLQKLLLINTTYSGELSCSCIPCGMTIIFSMECALGDEGTVTSSITR